MRKGDPIQVKKHLAQASILMDEYKMGYLQHKWLAIGHLAEAESECLEISPEFTDKIRKIRVAIITEDANPVIESLILEFCQFCGEDVKNISFNDANMDFKIKEEKKKLLYEEKMRDPNVSFRNLGKKYGVSHHTAKEWFEEYKNKLGNKVLEEF